MLNFPSVPLPNALNEAPAGSNPSNLSNLAPVVRLFPEEADRLLQRLVQAPWRRLSSEYDDPLGMLFGNRARQWTAGWDAEDLYLLVWETDSWQEKPVWTLYRNGSPIFQEESGFSTSRTQALQKLLESAQLPFMSQAEFLEPVLDYRCTEAQRRQASAALRQTLAARPEIFEPLKEALFIALEADLGSTDWPVLDILKVHRLAHKVPLVQLFRHCVETGSLRMATDTARLEQALCRLERDFELQGPKISSFFQLSFQQALQEYRTLAAQDAWRAQLCGVK